MVAIDQVEVSLTVREFDMLWLLAQSPTPGFLAPTAAGKGYGEFPTILILVLLPCMYAGWREKIEKIHQPSTPDLRCGELDTGLNHD